MPSSVACSCDDNDASTIGKFEVIADVQTNQPELMPALGCVRTASAQPRDESLTIPDVQDVTSYGITVRLVVTLWVHDMVIQHTPGDVVKGLTPLSLHVCWCCGADTCSGDGTCSFSPIPCGNDDGYPGK